MKRAAYLFVLVALIFTSMSFVSAAWNSTLNNGLGIYYDMNSTRELVYGKTNLTANEGSAVYNVTNCLIGLCAQTWENNTQKIPANDFLNYTLTNYTINFWVRGIDNGASGTPYFYGSPMNGINQLGWDSPTQIFAGASWDGTNGNLPISTVGTGNWFMMTVTRRPFNETNQNVSIYINGTIRRSGLLGNQSIMLSTGNPETWLGNIFNGIFDWHGQFDEFGFWNRTLGPSEITQLYNAGAGITLQSAQSNFDSILVDPPSGYTTNSSIINLTANFIAPLNINFTNATSYVYREGVLFDSQNRTITGGPTNTTKFIVTGLTIGNYVWNVRICASNLTFSNCTFALTNLTFTVAPSIESSSFNLTTLETAIESFRTNFTTPNTTSISSSNLFYNGTLYSSSFSGSGNSYVTNTSISIPIGPGIKAWRFVINYSDGTQSNFSLANQTVYLLNMTICGPAPQTSKFINFTFQDEATLTAINGSTDLATIVYSAGSTTINKTLLFTNTTQQKSFAYCVNPSNATVLASINYQYSATDYPQRTWTSDYILTNNTFNETLYLLNSADGIYVTFQTVNALGSIVEGVTVQAEREISGTPIIIAQGVTDSSGAVTFWLNPNFPHTITFTSATCSPTQFTITPTQTTYTTTLNCQGATTYDTSPIPGIIFQKSPASGIIVNGSTTFAYSVFRTTTNVSIVKAKFELFYSNGTFIADNETLVSSGLSFCGASQCNLTLVYNVRPGDDLKGKYYVDIGDGYVLLEGDAHWVQIRPNPDRTTGLKYALRDLRSIFSDWTSPTCSYSNDGLEGTNCSIDQLDLQNKLEYSRIVFLFLAMAIVFAVLGKFTGYDGANPGIFIYALGGLVVIGSLIGGLSGEGLFFYSNLTPFHFLNNYILAFTMMMVMGGYWSMLSRRTT
ncbi:MAG: LamG-like jellyroll fold domain-containing protein [Nitrososphaerales archaeon]